MKEEVDEGGDDCIILLRHLFPLRLKTQIFHQMLWRFFL